MKNLTDFCKTVETGVDPGLILYSRVSERNHREGNTFWQ